MMGVVAVLGAAIVAGAIAAVAGFGIGSVLTPLFAFEIDTKTAVVIVSLPHAAGTALRLWLLRHHIDRRVLASFGVASVVGGLAGAMLQARATSPTLATVLGILLVFAGVAALTGLAQRMRLGRRTAWIGGAASAFLGGLVGNQGGIRSAALMGFDLPKEAFIASGAAIAIFVDLARVTVYAITQPATIAAHWGTITIAIAGVVLGTFAGYRTLRRIPEPVFRRLVAILVLALGITMLVGIRK